VRGSRLNGMTAAIRMTLLVNGEMIVGEGVSDHDEGFVECLSFADGITTDQAPTGRSLGRRHYEPIVIRKRIDRTSPQMLSALSQSQPVEATFRFYRPAPDLGGMQHYFTVQATGARIVSIERTWSSGDPAEHEDVGIAPFAILWTHEESGTTVESRPRGVV
jgi:type VI secretion system secreted protein Hcp